MIVRMVRHLGRRWIIAVLVGCLSVSVILVSRTIPHAGAAGTPITGAPVGSKPSAPHFSFSVGGTRYWVEYEGNAERQLSQNALVEYFGTWRTWNKPSIFLPWYNYGDFKGAEGVGYDADGKIHGSVTALVPGIGEVTNGTTYSQIYKPNLPLFTKYPSPSKPLPPTYSTETILGARHVMWHALLGDTQPVGGTENQFDRGNVDNGQFPGISQTEDVPRELQSIFWDEGYTESLKGDQMLTQFENGFHTRLSGLGLPLPVILGLAGGVFFIAATAVNGVCSLSTCTRNTQRTMAGIGMALGIISGILGITSGLLTSLKAFATAANATNVGLAAANEAAGATNLLGASIGVQAGRGANLIAGQELALLPRAYSV